MEYKTIFGDMDFNAVRSGHFQNALGKYITLAKIIYNGVKYNFGSQDGAVVITNEFTLWKFIAPVNRFDMTHYAPMTLRQMLAEVVEDTVTSPIPAWDEFFSYLAQPSVEAIANQAIHGNYSSIRISYRNTELPLIQGCTDFASFMNWLGENSGEAGDIQAGAFINGQDMIIPLDQYVGIPKQFSLRLEPVERPTDYGTDIAIITQDNTELCFYGTKEGFYSSSVFYMTGENQTLVYAFDATSDADGLSIPAGWSVYNGTAYTAADAETLESVIIVYDETVTYTYLAKIFFDIAYETAEVSEYHLNSTVDFSLLPEGFAAGAYDFDISLTTTPGAQSALIVQTGSADAYQQYCYIENAEEMEDTNYYAGWNTINLATGKPTPYDMAANPVSINLIPGEYETTDMAALASIMTLQQTETKIKEVLDGTIYFMLRA